MPAQRLRRDAIHRRLHLGRQFSAEQQRRYKEVHVTILSRVHQIPEPFQRFLFIREHAIGLRLVGRARDFADVRTRSIFKIW